MSRKLKLNTKYLPDRFRRGDTVIGEPLHGFVELGVTVQRIMRQIQASEFRCCLEFLDGDSSQQVTTNRQESKTKECRIRRKSIDVTWILNRPTLLWDLDFSQKY